MVRVLLIDDDSDTGALVKLSLRPYSVTQAFTVEEGRQIVSKSDHDIILIDVSLPDGDGFSLCQEIATNPLHASLPLILLTSKDTVAEKVFGLNCGATDYVTKPFQPLELKARIDSHIRRQNVLNESILRHSDFEVDMRFQRCFLLKDGQRVNADLTPIEFRILMVLLNGKNEAFSRDQIIDSVWKSQGLTVEAKGVDTHISHLRKKMGVAGKRIVSVYGKGYLFKDGD